MKCGGVCCWLWDKCLDFVSDLDSYADPECVLRPFHTRAENENAKYLYIYI